MGLDNPLHIALLVIALLLVFGAKRIPEIARSLGTGLTEFRDAVNGRGDRSLKAENAEAPAAPAAAAAPAEAATAQAASPAAPPQAGATNAASGHPVAGEPR